jgi:DNA-binding transcriptional MerR regulator
MLRSAEEYSIGDVAKMLNLPVHTIRFWTGEFQHIECIRRNGRRYYDNKAVDELKKIKELSHKKGLKIDGIKQMLRYRKIDMEKLDKANKMDFQIKIDTAIKRIDKIIDLMSKC